MQKTAVLLSFAGAMLASLALAAQAASTDAADLARSENCMSCHAINNRVLGPGFKEIAKRYAGQPDAEGKLVQKVLKGGSGVWGDVAMPANAQLTEAEAHSLVQWILSLK